MDTESAKETDDEQLDEQTSAEDTSEQDQQTAPEPVNPLALSDDEVMGMASPEDMPDATQSADKRAANESDTDDASAPETKDADSSEEQPTETDEDSEKPDAKTESKSDSEEAIEQTPEQIAAEYEKLFQPMKAGKQTLQLRNVDEAIGLIKKGMDYHRKTEELAAHRKTIKTLQKAGINDSNLNYLIDLHNKDPQAIAKLVSDAKIDPLDLDTDGDKVNQYSPKQHAASDHEVALDEVLADLKATDTYGELVNVVGEVWDEDSRRHVANDPALLRVINDHMADGIYPIIAAETTRQRTLGHLKGLTDLAAYQQVGKAIDAQGGFDHLITDERKAQWAQNQGMAPIAKVTVRPPQGSSDPSLDAKRRAASPSKATSKKSKTSDQPNYLNMDDAEFEKKFSASLN